VALVFGLCSILGYVAAVRQNAGKLAMIGETRVLANCGYGTPTCQTLNQADFCSEFVLAVFVYFVLSSCV
jgi:hypothetical protein